MSDEVLSAIIVALITGAASIAVAYLQRSRPTEKEKIHLPPGVRLPQTRNILPWILLCTSVGAIGGYLIGGFRQAKVNIPPDPTAIVHPTEIIASSTSPVEAFTATDTPSNSPFPNQDTVTAESLTTISVTSDVAPTGSQTVACVTSQRGSGVPAEVQADSLILVQITGGSGPQLNLASGQEILFSSMKSFEVIQVSESPYRVRVEIDLLNGETITDDILVFNEIDAHLEGTAKYGSFSIMLFDLKRVEFRQGGCL